MYRKFFLLLYIYILLLINYFFLIQQLETNDGAAVGLAPYSIARSYVSRFVSSIARSK